MKHIFLINPAAGKSDSTLPLCARIRESCGQRGLTYDIRTTEYPRHAVQLVREIAADHPGEALRFYACGGDGTLNEVACGAAGLPGVSITHFPCGSGNDFIKLFGADAAAFHRLEGLLDGQELELDYIRSDRGISLNILTVGVDARIARDMQKYKRIPLLGGGMAYNASTVENVLKGLCEDYTVEVDGVDYSGRYTLILAGNGRFYGGGFCPVPEADPADGLLEVLLIREVSLFTVMRVIGAYKAGRHRELPRYITHLQARSMRIGAAPGRQLTLNLDGEIVQCESVSLEVAADKLRFAVPKGIQLLPGRES